MPGRVLFTLIGRSKTPPTTTSRTESSPSAVQVMKNLGRASVESHRPSLKGGSSSKSAPKPAPPPARLEVELESPPLVSYGPPATSTGALLSGQLRLIVDEPEVRLTHFAMDLRSSVTTKKPVVVHCPACSSQSSNVFRWEFLREPATFRRGTHEFPFSHLLPGRLPASSHGALASVDYALAARATSAAGEAVVLDRPLRLQRAIMPGDDKHSVRIFPPTALTTHVTLPNVVFPIGDFPVYLRLDGCVTRNPDGSQTRWRLRRMNWRLEEKATAISPACARHAHKLGMDGKGVLHQDSRVIGSDEFKNGWKTDLDAGQVEMEFRAAVRPGKQPVCDMESASGLAVTHALTLELIVAEEYSTGRAATPTGAARVLRMNFGVTLTERGGLGISWDEEQPPTYGDVPASPPSYVQAEDYAGPLEDDDGPGEQLQL
ncbi:MAG: hypothetical protein M1832_004262 [Thelocarpon impressellum]|nr:MAG: hypothetical protein M1832_004262 [Thelocarpon impressellum]